MAVAVEKVFYHESDYRLTSMESEMDESLTFVLKQAMSDDMYQNDYTTLWLQNIPSNQIEDEGLDPELENLIIEHDASVSPYNGYIKLEKEESDTESVMLDFVSLDFLDPGYNSSEQDDSTDSLSDVPSLRRHSEDSGFSDNSSQPLPDFDTIISNDESSTSRSTTEPLSVDDSELDDKPYCKSNRGAKNNLLWKFLLIKLDEPCQNLLSWVDKEEGTFRFDDTSALSKIWGEGKGKGDMNFEKLSRAIRHYYKSGLMSRVKTERLVYKFHWPSVPKRFRKY